VRLGVKATDIRHPRESPTSCSARAELRGDPMPGTGFSEGRVLFVEQPGPWGHSGLPESHFDRAVALELLTRAAAADVRVLAIRLPGRTPADLRRRWLITDGRSANRTLVGATFAQDGDLLDLDFDAPAGRPVDGPMYFVCAHSKRDVCCALRGRTVAAELAELRPGQVYECSHTGGHRFAANVLVAPSGLLYGRVESVAAGAFIAAAEAGVVLPALLRGRVGLPPAAQTALTHGYAELGLSRSEDLSVASVVARDGHRADITLIAPSGRFVVSVGWETVDVVGISCAKPWPDTIEAYRPLSIAPAGTAA
jgi:hypothetical protein